MNVDAEADTGIESSAHFECLIHSTIEAIRERFEGGLPPHKMLTVYLVLHDAWAALAALDFYDNLTSARPAGRQEGSEKQESDSDDGVTAYYLRKRMRVAP